MNIGIDVRILAAEKTGIYNYVFNIVKELQQIDKKNKIYLFSHTEFDFPLKNRNWNKVIGQGLTSKISKLWLQTQLPALAKHKDLDIFWATGSLIPINLDCSIKTLLTVYDLTYLFYPETMKTMDLVAYKLLQKKSILKTDKIITDSQATADDVVKNFPVEHNKIEVVWGAIDQNLFKIQSDERVGQILKKYQLPANFVLAVSTLEPRKNLGTVLNVYAKLLKEHLIPHDLVVVGASGWKDSGIYKQVKGLGLSDRVHFLGFVPNEDLPVLYSAARFSLYISLYEGFGIPILEAMACGCPVITSNVSSMPEVAGDAALLVDCRDIEGISKTIVELMNDDAKHNSLVAKGLNRVKCFDWKNRAQQILNIFEGIEGVNHCENH